MKIVTEEFTKTIENLIKKVSAESCSPEEFELSQKYNALPLGYDLWSVVLLTPKGEIIDQDWDGNIQHNEFDLQLLIRLLFVEKERFPEFENFILNRSDDSKDCPMCQSSGMIKDANGKDMRCIICAGIGWITKKTYETIQKNSE